MAGPDTKNAHIRGDQSRRESPDQKAAEAQRLMDDPAFIRGFDAVKEGLVNELSNLQHDGSPEVDAFEREVCRSLRTLQSLKRAISLGVQGQALRLAEFRSQPAAGEES